MLIALAYPPGGKQHALLARSAHADSLTGHRRRPLARARARDLPRDGMALRRGHDPREVIGPAPRSHRNRLRFLPPRSLSSAALFFPIYFRLSRAARCAKDAPTEAPCADRFSLSLCRCSSPRRVTPPADISPTSPTRPAPPSSTGSPRTARSIRSTAPIST